MSNRSNIKKLTAGTRPVPALKSIAWATGLSLLLAPLTPVLAEMEDGDAPVSASSTLIEEVLVSARKREEPVQEVPISLSAYSSDQLEALKIRDLKGMSVAMPNVAMDDVGTTRGVANFSIRGLGINSSIPAIDPTVGIFVDGVYIGQNAGTVVDMFDIESIEVLRGPQGTLFGRNVTGGAVLINSKLPTEEFELRFRAAVDANPSGDTGANYYMMGSASGALSENFQARLSVYHNTDKGWFENLYDGKNFGASETTIIRPVVTFQPSENVNMTLRWEHFETTGDGPASQTHENGFGVKGYFANFERDSFDFSVDERGFIEADKDSVTFQTDWKVPFGNGTITNIFGWIDYFAESYGDIDAQPVWLFHSGSLGDYSQYSNELRYNGNFGKANVTTGLYWFTNDLNYSEFRDLLGIATGGVAPALTQSGGGVHSLTSKAIFGAVNYDLSDAMTLNLGLRYTKEKKDVQIATLTRNINSPCRVLAGNCPYDFVDDNSWTAWSGKLGFSYALADDKRMYGHWSRGHRSGGYNLRNTAIDTVNLGPGPVDQETVDSFEIGYKSEFAGRGRLNAALFFTAIDDMQRELNLADPYAGVVQVFKNTADAEIWGFEVDGVFAVSDSTVLTGSLGWVDPKYKSVRYDINSDGMVDHNDMTLGLPRAAKWTWSMGLNHDWTLSNSSLVAFRINYAFRDDSFYTDNNRGILLSQKMLDSGIDYNTADGRWVFSVYGRNLLNSVNHGGDTQLPSLLGPVPTGGAFAPLVKGRIMGIEITFNY